MGDMAVQDIIQRRSEQKRWPITRSWLDEFDTHELTRVRLHSSSNIKHEAISSIKCSGNRQKSCALCAGKDNSDPNSIRLDRLSYKMCSTCLVPLCCTVLEGETESHFQRWHKVKDLKKEQKVCNAMQCSELLE